MTGSERMKDLKEWTKILSQIFIMVSIFVLVVISWFCIFYLTALYSNKLSVLYCSCTALLIVCYLNLNVLLRQTK